MDFLGALGSSCLRLAALDAISLMSKTEMNVLPLPVSK